MITRFEGDEGDRRLIEALAEQVLIAHDAELAAAVAACGTLISAKPGEVVIAQGGNDNDIYFIIAGTCDVIVNGRKVSPRGPGVHVGEMALIRPSQPRSATVTATTDAVLLRVSEPDFLRIITLYPAVALRIARELAKRLEQRNALVGTTHDKIRVFIMSSAESLHIARAIQNGLEYDPFIVTVWTDGVFRASSYPLAALDEALDQTDFAVAIAAADDVTKSRNKKWPTTRDNVVFELGFFMGRLGKDRSLLVERRGDEVKLPSDLAGLTTLSYKWSGELKELHASIAPICNRLRDTFKDLGPNN